MHRNYIIHPHGFWFSKSHVLRDKVQETIETVLRDSENIVVLSEMVSDDPNDRAEKKEADRFLEYLDKAGIEYSLVMTEVVFEDYNTPNLKINCHLLEGETYDLNAQKPDTVIVLNACSYAALLFIEAGDTNNLFGCYEEACLKGVKEDSEKIGASAHYAENGTLPELYWKL